MTETETRLASLTYALLNYVKQEENIDIQIASISQTLKHLIEKKTDSLEDRLGLLDKICSKLANSLIGISNLN